jgi:hypothetical protein
VLVQFNQARVTSLKMVSGAVVREFLAKREQRPTEILASATSPGPGRK